MRVTVTELSKLPGYDEGMSTRRITLNLPETLIDSAERAVAEGRARSVSAYVTAVAGAGEARTTLADAMSRWAATAEPAADADEWARQFMARNDDRYQQRRPGEHAA